MKVRLACTTFLLALCSCNPGSVERRVRLNIYSTSTSERQFAVVVKYDEVDSATYRLVGTDARHDSLLLDSGLVSISIVNNRVTLSQSLWIVPTYAEPIVDVYFADVDSTLHGAATQSLSVFHYDKRRLLLE
jgi:hypothetical protein